MTKAQFIRDCKSGSIKFEMMYRYGEEIPERLKGVRTVSKVNTVSVFLMNSSGIESELYIPCASLMEYDGETLTIYNPIERSLTEEERKVYIECLAERKKYENQNPYSESYWHMKKVYSECKFPWLDGYEKKQGKRFSICNETVFDDSQKGKPILKYRIIK